MEHEFENILWIEKLGYNISISKVERVLETDTLLTGQALTCRLAHYRSQRACIIAENIKRRGTVFIKILIATYKRHLFIDKHLACYVAF